MIAQKIPLAPGLWLVGVPIGTARDITLRALDVLASADVLAAEDTRTLRKLMDIHGIPLDGRPVFSLHDHSGQSAVDRLVSHIDQRQSVAYASEAGMPLIADPGYELVNAVRAKGHTVTSAPGPTALTTALALAGLGTDRFFFAGFLPNTSQARQKALADLAPLEGTLAFYESPKRVHAMLQDAAQVLGDRPARLCRELTKKFEEIRAGRLSELAAGAQAIPPKGEIVVLIEKATRQDFSTENLETALARAMETMSVKDAAAFVAEATGRSKRHLYQIALKLRD